ncbi:MAG: Ig-like domain-containing protein, partial [Clostridia bacterium]|nr:Ig-like domain-containing protein [Clostridia bacterium]
MFKKSLSIILSVVMLLSIFPSMTILGALPTGTLAIDADGNVTTEGVAVDNFEQHTVEQSNFNYYPGDTSATSSVFNDVGSQGGNGVYSLVKHTDISGSESMMLKMKATGWANAYLPVKTIKYSMGKTVRFAYDIYFDELPETNACYTYFGANNTNYNFMFYPANDTNGSKLYAGWSGRTFILTADVWYRIIGVVNTSGVQTLYLVNPYTDEILLTSETCTYTDGGALDLYAAQFYSGTPSASVLIDNAELMVYTPSASLAPSVLKTSTGNENVPTAPGTMEITFDQIIKTAPETVTLTGGLSAAVSKVSNKLNTYALALPSMEGSTTYTIDLSGFKNDADAYCESYSFTTAAAAPYLASSVPADGATNVSVETNSMTLNFSQAMTEYPTSISIGRGITASVTPSNDNKSFTLSWADELEGNVTYTVALANFKNGDGTAVATASVSFTTENTGIVTLTDSFEDNSLIENGGYQYNTAGNTEKSPLMMTTGNRDCLITQVDGYTSGTKAFQLKAGSDWRDNLKTTVKYVASDDVKLVATYRLRIDDLATDNTLIPLGGTYGGSYAPGQWDTITVIQTKDMNEDGSKELVVYSGLDDTSTAREISEDKWYNITYVSGLSSESIYIVDSETGILVYEKTSGHPSSSFDAENYIVPYTAQATGGNNANLKTTIDDFTLRQVDSSNSSHKLALDGEITGSNGEYTMSFNQPVIGTKDMLAVAEVTGSEPAEYNYDIDFEAEFLYPDFCTQTVSLSELPYKSSVV